MIQSSLRNFFFKHVHTPDPVLSDGKTVVQKNIVPTLLGINGKTDIKQTKKSIQI